MCEILHGMSFNNHLYFIEPAIIPRQIDSAPVLVVRFMSQSGENEIASNAIEIYFEL